MDLFLSRFISHFPLLIPSITRYGNIPKSLIQLWNDDKNERLDQERKKKTHFGRSYSDDEKNVIGNVSNMRFLY